MSEPKPRAIDYTKYTHLHLEDSPRKIAEIGTVLPPSFRGAALLDVGCDAGLITQDIGKRMGAGVVHVVEPSVQAHPYAQESLQEFPTSVIHPVNFSDLPHQGVVFDLMMFNDVLEHVENPVGLLQKASKVSRFAVIRSPLEDSPATRLHTKFYGEDITKLMEERYGHIHHFNRPQIREMVEEGGFDIIAENATRIPKAASLLDHKPYAIAEAATWHLAQEKYPELWGGFYLALLKSRNVEVMPPETASNVKTQLAEEFGEENIVSIGIFGSTTRETDKKHSDYDFTIIVRDLPEDIHEREAASPRIKKRLREAGVDELCAFNLYTPEEFQRANDQKSWLVETMKVGYRVLSDRDGFLKDILSSDQPGVKRIDNSLAWRGVEYEDGSHLTTVIERHQRTAGLITEIDPQLANYHEREAQRGCLIKKLYEHGEYDTRGSLFSLAKKLNYKYGESLDLAIFHQEDFQQEMEGKGALYGYDTVDRHLRVAEVLAEHQMPLDALFHTYAALRNVYLKALHSQDKYIVDGEITQLFLRDFSGSLPSELTEKLYANSFKAEQVLGRSGFVSFDVDQDGKPIYEDPQTSQLNYGELTANVRDIVDDLRSNQDVNPSHIKQDKPTVSVVVATYNRPEQLDTCIDGLNKQIIPDGKAELVIVDDGSIAKYDVDHIREKSKLPVTFISKDHSGICDTKNTGIEASKGEYVAFLDDDMVASPLWLVNLLSGFKNDQIAGVGSTNYVYPDTHYLAEYADYRELMRQPFKDKMGEVLNVLTGSACLRKDVLEEVGGFNIRQSEDGVPFGGDDVDLTWNIRNAGYSLGHVEAAVTYLNPRGTFKDLVKQHIGYGEGTMYHVLDTGRDAEELGIPEATYPAVAKDLLKYVAKEVPKRVADVYQAKGAKEAVVYPLLDLTRRASYDVGILKARKFRDKNVENTQDEN